jgi:hypothetical protein
MALVECKECKAQISDKAEACPQCGAKIKKPSGCFVFVLISIVVLVIIGSVSGGRSNQTKTATTPTETPETAAPNTWKYSTNKDDVSGKPFKDATVLSNNTEQLEFPYQGGTVGFITIRNHPRYGKDIIFQVNKGQLSCQYNNCYISIRFDDGPVIKNYVTEPADNSHESYFLSNYKKTLAKIQASKKIYVEVTFHSQGSRTFEFNTYGLNKELLN